MFEEVCLVCGRHLRDDGRAYCSSDCENADISSPSISSASSTLSSPYLGHTVGGEVPALLPSVLGATLKKHHTRDRYSISSSSASSASWSVPTDDEGEEPVLGIGSEHNPADGIEHNHELNIKSSSTGHSVWSAALSYARLPSCTDNRSTVPHVQKRTVSGSPSHVRGTLHSAPIPYHTRAEEEEGHPDFGFSSRDNSDSVEINHHPSQDNESTHSTTKLKRARNRASLPACFSLLQISNEARSSPVSSSSGHTIARASPPTPKLILSTSTVHPPPLVSSLAQGDSVQVTPRGRRRIPDNRGLRQSDSTSPSRPRSRTHYNAPHADMLIDLSSHQPENRGTTRYTSNRTADPGVARGRDVSRRNISPSSKAYLDVQLNTKAKKRGRLRVDELDAPSSEAPGYGNGRSGLMGRERVFGTRTILQY
ncbi:hypothetical protein AX15_006252 [Amanita polypyramis BW_CC]|nr:hypothetical protein AX15_006252 [Amanita polypyramis BW_CC]